MNALVAAVQRARRIDDTVVVFLHWGIQLDACPDPIQEPLATALVRAGADIVIGSHAHVLLGAGYRGTALVDYGLGNFAFYNDPTPDGLERVARRHGDRPPHRRLHVAARDHRGRAPGPRERGGREGGDGAVVGREVVHEPDRAPDARARDRRDRDLAGPPAVASGLSGL